MPYHEKQMNIISVVMDAIQDVVSALSGKFGRLPGVSSKIIFEDNILCAQFLRDYIDLPYLKNVKPEDIEDVSEQYVPLFAEERNADRVKRVNIKNENPFFLVSIVEYKSQLDYNVIMQIFLYMVYIWEKYEKEAEKLHKGITKRADFEYYLVPLRKYSNEELLAKKDEISLVMMINRMQNENDIEEFRNLPAEEAAKHQLENSIRIYIETCRELGLSKENLIQKMVEKYAKEEVEILEKVGLYWQE